MKGSLSVSQKACVILALFTATAIASSAQTVEGLASFNGPNGSNPLWGSMVQGTDGKFYGNNC
jgi:hypothetical protein